MRSVEIVPAWEILIADPGIRGHLIKLCSAVRTGRAKTVSYRSRSPYHLIKTRSSSAREGFWISWHFIAIPVLRDEIVSADGLLKLWISKSVDGVASSWCRGTLVASKGKASDILHSRRHERPWL